MMNGLIAMVATAAACLGAGAVAQTSPTGLHRWFDLQSATVAMRYRTITSSQDVRTTNQAQHNESLRARLLLDRAKRYTMNFGAFTGSSMTAGWNNTGMGTGDPSAKFYLKQLFVTAAPWQGIEFQYGSLYFVRGENTEITTYDNDAYFVGLRGSVRRPDVLFFDELSATQGYLSPLAPPSVFDRGSPFRDVNYWQVLVGKRAGKQVGASIDYTRALERDTVRTAFTIKSGATRVIDLIRVEAYHRLAADAAPAATGYAAYVERSLFKRLVAGGGWANIDQHYGGLNSDRIGAGRRVFLIGTVVLLPELTLQSFYTVAPSSRFPIPNRTRFELVVTYNVLRALERRGVFQSMPSRVPNGT